MGTMEVPLRVYMLQPVPELPETAVLPYCKATPDLLLVGGVVVWLAGHAHLSCLNIRQWITIGVDIYSFFQTCQIQQSARSPATPEKPETPDRPARPD
jgi:hypothetical protein